MKTVADAMEVSRSNLIDRTGGRKKKRGRYRKQEDAELIQEVQKIVDERPTYGYRRITSLLNKERQARGLPAVNHKRVFRLMSTQNWLLQKHTARRTGRSHDGKVITMRSNMRWCSDGFEITCWDGGKMRVAFIIDAFDREIIAWTAAANRGISGDLICDMMLQAVEVRFGSLRTPTPIEFLTDNGSCYTAKETLDFARSLGLKPCFTPPRSPESNGMAESFVKTFKRDYVQVTPLPTLRELVVPIMFWFDDYNVNHPHSGLGWKSPKDFIEAQSPGVAIEPTGYRVSLTPRSKGNRKRKGNYY